jgi:hypothetical protein
MKYLLAVGCSFTAGDGLPKRSIVSGSNVLSPVHRLHHPPAHGVFSAPFLVANKLGLYSTDEADGKKPEYVNLSEPGACNSMIKRKTINWLCENKDRWKDIIVLVGWSNPLRDELFIADWYPESGDHRYTTLDGTDGYLQLGSKGSDMEYQPPQIKEDVYIDNNFYKEYIVHHYSFKNQISITIDNILTLQNFLKVNNIKYVFWNSLNLNIRGLLLHKKRRESKFDHPDIYEWNKKGKYISHHKWIRSDIDFSWEEFLDDLDPPHRLKYRLSKKNDHPNELGHKLWADEIYKKIEELYGKEL